MTSSCSADAWLIDDLPYHLVPILEIRYPAAHSDSVGTELVRHKRSRILGIRCAELLVPVVSGKGE